MKKLIVDDAIPFLEGRLEKDFDIRIMPGAQIRREDLMDADGVLVRTRTRCDASTLEGTPVSFVATGTIGLDHIDTQYCDAHGIHWQNAPGCNAPAVAQYVWRALFELGFDPRKMTLGAVGKGHVGSIVAQWGRALGAKVIVSDPPRQKAGYTDEEYLPLEDLMEQADAVTLHTPLIKKPVMQDGILMEPTVHLADAVALGRLRNGAIVVNAARGGIVDERALMALKGEKGLKIAIDTWEGEPKINTDTLRGADIATFHIAGYSQQGKERATRAILEGLEKHFGVRMRCDDLCGPYKEPAELTEAAIRESYDIMADDALMRREYEDFERLRDTYPLRTELGVCKI